MPVYDAVCPCGHAFEYIESMQRCRCVPKCPQCGSFLAEKVLVSPPKVRCPDSGWESENGGRGRYIGQLAPRPDVKDPEAYCRSRTDMVEKATRQGRKVTLI